MGNRNLAEAVRKIKIHLEQSCGIPRGEITKTIGNQNALLDINIQMPATRRGNLPNFDKIVYFIMVSFLQWLW